MLVIALMAYSLTLASVLRLLAVAVFPTITRVCGIPATKKKMTLKFAIALRELVFYSCSTAIHLYLYGGGIPDRSYSGYAYNWKV